MGKEESWTQLDRESLFQMARGSVGEGSSGTETQTIAADCDKLKIVNQRHYFSLLGEN